MKIEVMYKNALSVLAIIFLFILLSCASNNTYRTGQVEYNQIRSSKPQKSFSMEIQDKIRMKINNLNKTKHVSYHNYNIQTSTLMKSFYLKRNYSPAWFDDNGPKVNMLTLIDLINNDTNGLNPEFYNIDLLKTIYENDLSSSRRFSSLSYSDIAVIDIIYTNSLLYYSSDLLYGSKDTSNIVLEDTYPETYTDISAFLNYGVDNDNLIDPLNALLPHNPVYDTLRYTLIRYNKIKEVGGWPEVPYGKKLQLGDRDRRVIIIRSRLIASGDLNPSQHHIDNDLFDKELEYAVMRFQNRHGLYTDGIVGNNTLRAMNISIDSKIEMIKLNLNLWRRLPQNLGERYLIVNVPAFKLYGFERNSAIFDMKVVVGKVDWITPVLSDEMTYMVINPYWNIPRSIVKDEIIPELLADPTYLEKKNIKIISSWETNSVHVDSLLINWEEVDAETWEYRLRQEPGPSNPLGRLKFMFPNRHNVYLHDTPLKDLFQKETRKFSHGCIRVEKPLELAEFVFEYDPQWNSERISTEIETGENKLVSLPNPLPVHVFYFTVWVESDNSVHFREDIYNYYSVEPNIASSLPN